jgi:carbamoylphosphate synthase large subunit
MRLLILVDFHNVGLRVVHAARPWADHISVVTPSAATPLAHSSRVDAVHTLPLKRNGRAEPESCRQILDICASQRIDAVIGADVDGAHMLNAIRAVRPDLRGPATMPDTLLDTVNDKARFASLLRGAGLPEPATTLAETSQRLLELGASRRFPLMAKPPDSSGGQGVVHLASMADLRAYAAARGDDAGSVVIQDYLPGREIGFSAYVDGGRVLGSSVQCWLSAHSLVYVDHPEAETLGRTAIERLGLSGPVNFDMREDATGRLHFIECNPRFWSTLNLSAALGANFVEVAVRSSLGEAVRFQPPRTGRVMLLMRGALRLLAAPHKWPSAPPEALRALAWEAGDMGATARRVTQAFQSSWRRLVHAPEMKRR